ncbi:hypothetical protein PtA15_1A7 [Puccinia triticina]|uniref:Uncharacterized protein n=1 Tax=Puccinia triticina TaxID=208348 RepID=A0ABY7C680_9BASI|nr:uncharacterized protein PtA15_1A7 [Puccinia triticina]WAQ80669.1 hypothetical protein PtA15_1A7 [Puccinia triticina]
MISKLAFSTFVVMSTRPRDYSRNGRVPSGQAGTKLVEAFNPPRVVHLTSKWWRALRFNLRCFARWGSRDLRDESRHKSGLSLGQHPTSSALCKYINLSQ